MKWTDGRPGWLDITPPTIAQTMRAAIGTMSPEHLRATADALEHNGWPDQAAELRKHADGFEQANKAAAEVAKERAHLSPQELADEQEMDRLSEEIRNS